MTACKTADADLDAAGRKRFAAREALSVAEMEAAWGMRRSKPDMAERWEAVADAEEKLLRADRAFRETVQQRQTARRMRKGGLL